MLNLNKIQTFKGDCKTIWGVQVVPPEHIVSMNVIEKRNDTLSLEMTCIVSDNNIKTLVAGNIIKCYKDIRKKSLFSFEIYDVKYSIDNTIVVKAEHISSRLRYIYVRPGIVTTNVLSGIPLPIDNGKNVFVNYDYEYPFKIKSTISATAEPDHVKSVRDIMSGSSGSILDIVGYGDWMYEDDTTITFMQYIDGNKKDLTPIRYSNNMLDFSRQIELDNARATQVLFWEKETDGVKEYVWACNKKDNNIYPFQASQLVDLSSKFETKPTKEQLLAAAPSVSTSPEVTTSCTIANYEDPDAMCGRKVNVFFPLYGVNEKMIISEITYNVLTDRYDSIKLGTLKKTLSRTIAEIAGKTGTNVY